MLSTFRGIRAISCRRKQMISLFMQRCAAYLLALTTQLCWWRALSFVSSSLKRSLRSREWPRSGFLHSVRFLHLCFLFPHLYASFFAVGSLLPHEAVQHRTQMGTALLRTPRPFAFACTSRSRAQTFRLHKPSGIAHVSSWPGEIGFLSLGPKATALLRFEGHSHLHIGEIACENISAAQPP